ncbi:MAG TPA: DUF2127 domain-containing protein [Candidatus Acidoferrum sp.]|jgi:uncharacterized membrane protein|nr:DUF2127 domain-containing protein [Candidatus Acidoferrum sp.]
MSSPVTATPQQRNVLRNTFRCGIVLKGLHALLESVTGTTLFFLPARTLNRIAFRLARLDFLSRNPHDVIGTHLRHMAVGVTGTGRRFAAIYLLSHGLVKLVLVIELLRNRLWAYPLMIVMLSVFIGYQSYRFWLTHSIVMAALTIFDLAVIVLTWLEYREQLKLRHPG